MENHMELLRWSTVDRKRRKDIRFTDPEYVLGYDIDMEDMTELVTKFNAHDLSPVEENRLTNHVLTLMQIVTENPRINPRPGEMDELTDAMFIDCWNSMKYIKPNAKPYSYMYRAGYTCACRFFKTKITKRLREEELQSWIDDEYAQYMDDAIDHKVRNDNRLSHSEI